MNLHQHQAEAIAAIQAPNAPKVGRVIIPTGGGKTLIEATILRDIIIKDGRNLHLVLAPRIALVNQLIKEYRNFCGQEYVALAFHSGNMEKDYSKVKWVEEATTLVEKVRSEQQRAKRLQKDLVVFSTYASVHKLANMKFDTVIADESQYCVQENTYEVITEIDSTHKYFFTATEKHTDYVGGRGLNNEDTFGPVIYQIAPKELIKRNVIVPPKLHVMEALRKNNELQATIDEVVNIAKFHKAEASKKLKVCKVLFAMKGTDDVKNIVDNATKIKKQIPEGFKLFTIVSNNKYGAMVDGVKMSRGEFFKQLRETDNALIFHYDILSEGIDVDGITGVAVLRNMGHAKLLQTIGRAVRIYKANPAAKKTALITCTAIDGDAETADYVRSVIKMIRDGGFEVNKEDVKFTKADGRGIADEDDLEDAYDLDKKNAGMTVLDTIFHDLEQESIILKMMNMPEEDMIKEMLK